MSSNAGAAEQHNTALSGGTVYAVQNGDQYIYIYQNEPPYQVQQLSLAPDLPADILASRAPSWLLSASHQVVPFHGRDRVLAWLRGWRDARQADLSVRLVHGPGGQGKTRLATQFATLSAEAGWTVMAAHHRSDAAADSGDQQIAVQGTGLLVVVDYAERWPLDDLIKMLRQHRTGVAVPVRILLIARSAGDWWQSLAYHLSKFNIIDLEQWELERLSRQPFERQKLYTIARDRFTSILTREESSTSTNPNLDGAEFDLVLSIHMKALVDADASIRGISPPSGRHQASLSSYLLERERDYWRAANNSDRGPIRTTELAMSHAVYVATLAGPLAYEQAVDTLTRAGIAETSSQPVSQVLMDHRVLYPTRSDAVLGPLYPDRLGEDFIALTTAGHHLNEHQPDPWAGTCLTRLSERWQDPAQAITILIQAAVRWHHLATYHLAPIFRHRPELALAAGGSALAVFAGNPAVDIATLEAIEAAFPEGRHVDLDVGIAAVTARLTDHYLETTKDPIKIGQLYWTLGHRYANAGLLSLAVATTRRAVEVYRELVEQDGKEFELLLCPLLNNLSSELFRLGEYREALELGRKAETICRTHLDAGDGGYLSLLTNSLTNVSLCLSKLGQTEDALVAAEEAVVLRRDLASYDSALFEPDLANALDVLGMQLWGLGRRQQALAATKDAVSIRRRLAADNPAENEPELASSLNNLSIRLGGLGYLSEAVTFSQEAVEISHRLATANPSSFKSNLADALQNHASFLADVGQPHNALAKLKEAVALYRPLVRLNPALHEPSLGGCLNKLAGVYDGLQLTVEAMASIEEAVAIYRRLAASSPLSYLPELAASLTNLAMYLLRSGKRAEALPPAKEAVEIRRQQAAASPDRYDHKLAGALSNLSLVLESLERLDDALAANREALTIRRRLAKAEPGAFNPDLAASLYNLGNALAQKGKMAESIALTQEAVDIYFHLAHTNAAAFEPALAEALENVGVRFATVERTDDALQAFEQVVNIRRRLATAEPNLFGPLLSNSLQNLSRALLILARRDESLSAIEEALDIIQPLVQLRPELYAEPYIKGLLLYAELLEELGRPTEAAAIRRFLSSMGIGD